MQDPSMKLSISRDTLFAALQLVGRAVSTRATLPSLGGIELTAGSDDSSSPPPIRSSA